MKMQFVSNKNDNNHCLQASLMMVAAAVGYSLSWDEVDKLSLYDPRYYTWASTVIAPFSNIFPGIKLISSMDYLAFSEQGENYLREIWPLDWFKIQQEHSSPNFNKEQKAAKEAVIMNLIQNSTLQLQEMENFLENNFLIVLVDAGKLVHENYSSGHYVFVYDSDNWNFIIHDPGLPSHKKFKVDKNEFVSAFQGDVIVVPKKP